ncbi:DUF1428 domain-containing protein [Sphingopyxis sp. XHP0097]|uniref:DUF1428 domain-containing protein n=2 Tax=Sphingopyxis jiangsuensis TaxID=2871171 RepID=A0ABS7MF12_9SPHN|nr:DUF1428 domain-containing protein [Sphingopyxis jiangsuensis]
MTYVEGFVVAVPTANKEAYRKHAADAAPLFREFGATRMVECWGDDVPDGKINDFKGAVKAKDDETVVFSWFEYPDKATRDAANEKIMSDPRMKEMGATMPFDGKRMIFGGFAVLLDEGPGSAMGYADGYLVPVSAANKQAYRTLAEKMAPLFLEFGATRVVECWADDVPTGEVTDFARAVHSTGDEIAVFSWVEWPDKAARVAGWAKMMADNRMQGESEPAPFDGKRMIYGGFAPIVEA